MSVLDWKVDMQAKTVNFAEIYYFRLDCSRPNEKLSGTNELELRSFTILADFLKQR